KPLIRVAETGGGRDQCFEHRLKIESRTANHLEHVGGGGLLLERFAQFVEQPRVLDSDHRLRREILQQLDLLLGEGLNLLGIDTDSADQLILLEHWDGEQGSIAGKLGTSDHTRIALDVGLHRPNIRDVRYLLRYKEAAKPAFWMGRNTGSYCRFTVQWAGAFA